MKLNNIPFPKTLKATILGCTIALSSLAASPTFADDGRTALVLTEDQRDFILLEMRTFLESVQGIITAITEEDLDAISEIASAVGMSEAGKTPPEIVALLPDEFKRLAGATHMGFDFVAVEAQDMGDMGAILFQLGELMQNCTGCHAGYRIDLAD